MKEVYLYGLAGAKDHYRVARYYPIDAEIASITEIKYRAEMMRIKYPGVMHVYAVDNRRGLRRDYLDSIKSDSIESCAIFKDILEREGWKVI